MLGQTVGCAPACILISNALNELCPIALNHCVWACVEAGLWFTQAWNVLNHTRPVSLSEHAVVFTQTYCFVRGRFTHAQRGERPTRVVVNQQPLIVSRLCGISYPHWTTLRDGLPALDHITSSSGLFVMYIAGAQVIALAGISNYSLRGLLETTSTLILKHFTWR